MIKVQCFFLAILFLTACTPPAPSAPLVIETPTPVAMPTPTPTSMPTPIPTPTPEPIDELKEVLADMSIRKKFGRLLICRLPVGTTVVNAAVQHMIEELHLGGFILFGENIKSIEQTLTLTTDLQALSSSPLFIAIDEEGGRVSRIGKLYDEKIPYALQIGQTGDPQAAYDANHAIGKRLTGMGINMNFAPVADIWTNEANTVIGRRAYGKDGQSAAPMVHAAVRGLKDAGVLSVVKHFPGHGGTSEDSHRRIALYNHDRARFDAEEVLPFIQGIAAGADGVMAGHIATPLMQKESPILDWMEPLHTAGMLPTTFSDYWLTDVLRHEMAYDGLIITDALEMGALTTHFTSAQIAVGAFLAGADILLIPADPYAAVDALEEAYEAGLITDERLDASVRRILCLF